MSWPYPWLPNEDPDFVVNRETGERNRDNHDFYLWFESMRRKYGYPRSAHVAKWEPRFADWLVMRAEGEAA